MANFDNTFIRDPSPNFSDDINSDSAMATLPIDDKRTPSTNFDNCSKLGYQSMNAASPNHCTAAATAVINGAGGRNTFAFWTLVVLLFVLTIGNLILTVTIVGVLRLGKGMHAMELIQEADTVKFFGTTDLDRIYKRDGIIEGFTDTPMSITGDSGPVLLTLVRNNHSNNKMMMGKNGTSFRGINHMEIRDPVSSETIFSTHKPHFNIPTGAESLKARMVSTSRVTSAVNEVLRMQAKGKISLRGSEGTSIDSKDVLMTADQNIYFKSFNGSIVLSSAAGVFVDMKNIPLVQAEHGIRAGNVQYKMCVCMPQGKLFRLAVPRSHNSRGNCLHFVANQDPCI